MFTASTFAFGAVCMWFIAGCAPQADYSVESYQAAVSSALKGLPVARQMEEVFPDTDHMIIMYGYEADGPTREWQTVSFFGGRYELTYITRITLSEDGQSVVATGNGGFLKMWVVDKAIDGGAFYDSDRGRTFLEKDWTRFYEGGKDLLMLDPAFDDSVVPGFREYVDASRATRGVWKTPK